MPLAQRIASIAGVAALCTGAIGTSAFADNYSTQSVTQYSTQNGYSAHTTVQTPQGTQTYDYSVPANQLNVSATFPPALPPLSVSIPSPFPVNVNLGMPSSQSSLNESSSPDVSSMSSISSQPSSSEVSSSPDNSALIAQMQQEIQQLQQTIADLEAQIAAENAGSPSSSTGMTAVMFHANLTADQTVPPVASSGSGLGMFTLNGNTLSYHITVQNLTSPITAAHFHLGAAGQNGSVIQPIEFSGSTADGVWNNLTQDQINDLNAGLIYVNVHTSNFPDGEIRGQVLP